MQTLKAMEVTLTVLDKAMQKHSLQTLKETVLPIHNQMAAMLKAQGQEMQLLCLEMLKETV